MSAIVIAKITMAVMPLLFQPWAEAQTGIEAQHEAVEALDAVLCRGAHASDVCTNTRALRALQVR